jgi:large subunit ribosomal protein L18
MVTKIDKNADRLIRHKRIRNNVAGTPEKPRFCVYRSLSHIYVQIIDDTNGNTLCSCSTVEKDIKEKIKGKTKKDAAKIIGYEAAVRAKQKGIENVVFDRGGYIYTGRVQSVADGAREAGLKF